MQSLRVEVLGQRSELSGGCELIVLGWSAPGKGIRFDPNHFDERWDELANADIGNWRTSALAMKCERGVAEWTFTTGLSLFVLAHPWSGTARFAVNNVEVKLDLYSEHTGVRRFDTATMALAELTRVETDELAFVLAHVQVGAGWKLASIGAVAIAALDESGEPVKPTTRLLGPPPRPFKGEPAALIPHAGGGWTLAGEVRLQLADDAMLTLRRGPGQGTCVIDAGSGSRRVTLEAEAPGLIELTAATLASLPDERHFLAFEENYFDYDALLARIDPALPVALHVPRWKGVASSTLNLFEQRLPIPLNSDTPPETITDADIVGYARMLLATGAQHFVISGGDLFFIRLIRAVHATSPAVRFDLLWHSNWVQMGEPADWAILRQWLAAWNEGLVTRIGFVKAGLDTFFLAHGVDAVFIPNVIMTKPDEIRPSAHDGAVGIWLSGSSDYRKLPHAALLALAESRSYPLKASGLNYVARRLIDTLNLPVRKVWVNPIPRAQLYREMADTAATLYVTLSECSPMLPLESFALGVPCLVGPSSHLFRDDPWLAQRLVVEDPLNSTLIARKLDRVIAEREGIVAHYQGYASSELAQAERGIESLIA
ncbi:MAG: glycosyltransferase [Sphingomonas sp.]|nr:glycosyltransferase [Sphingomonas sp.]